MSDIKGFCVEDIDECCICGAKSTVGVREGVTQNIGIGQYHRTIEICSECFNKSTFQNSHGFTFLKLGGDLYCYKPLRYLDFGFRQVLYQRDIELAFNPERQEFEYWVNK